MHNLIHRYPIVLNFLFTYLKQNLKYRDRLIVCLIFSSWVKLCLKMWITCKTYWANDGFQDSRMESHCRSILNRRNKLLRNKSKDKVSTQTYVAAIVNPRQSPQKINCLEKTSSFRSLS